MASGAPNRVHRFIEVGWSFPSILLGSRALRWMVPEIVLRYAVTLLGFTWLLSLPMWGLMWMGYLPFHVLRL
jgi:hypothetical protein